MTSSQASVIGICTESFPAFLRQRAFVGSINMWMKGRQQLIPKPPESVGQRWQRGGITNFPLHGDPWMPKQITDEYEDIATRSPDPWAMLVVRNLAQTAYIDGVRLPKAEGNLEVWDKVWQPNRFDSRQIALNKAIIGHGVAYGVSAMGEIPLTGEIGIRREAVSALEMAGFYNEPSDEWAAFAIRAVPAPDDKDKGFNRWTVRYYDDHDVHFLSCKNDGTAEADWTYLSAEPHGANVPPVVRFCNDLDLEGRSMGEIEPVIPLLRRIDQDTFDRLIVQRFGAWKVRWIAGMAKPTTVTDQQAAALALRMEDLLVSDNKDTKFGTLEATPLDGFDSAKTSDLRVLSAVMQIPPHHLLGLSDNLQAEALEAAEKGLQRKSADFKTNTGESHEQWFRLDAAMLKIKAEASAFGMQVIWRDTESRSFIQAVTGLQIVATQLGVPLEMVWERLPGWTDQDSERAKALVQRDGINQLIAMFQGANGTPLGGATVPAPGSQPSQPRS